jgi:hypothetical protein
VGAPRMSVRQSKPPQRYSGYMALMSDLIDKEPSSFQEASESRFGGCHGGGACLHHEE